MGIPKTAFINLRMKTIAQSQFRVLLTLYIVVMIISIPVGMLTDHWLLPHSLQDYLNANRINHYAVHPRGLELVICVLAIPAFAGWVISIIGLYQFWPCARWLSLTTWIYMLVLMAVSPEPVITSALDGALSQFQTLLIGVILGIIYFSPAADWFRKRT
jgi:hypothetical protein